MAEPPAFWTYVLANFTTFGFGVVLTGLSFFASRADPSRRSLRLSTLGFGLLTVGGLVAPTYQLAIKGQYALGGRELLAVQSVEGLFLAAGLGMLFWSVYRYSEGGGPDHVERHESIDPHGSEPSESE